MDIFPPLYGYTGRRTCREMRSIPSKTKKKKTSCKPLQSHISATHLSDRTFSDSHTKMRSYHHGNKHYCVGMFWGKKGFFFIKLSVSGAKRYWKRRACSDAPAVQPVWAGGGMLHSTAHLLHKYGLLSFYWMFTPWGTGSILLRSLRLAADAPLPPS